MDNESTLRKEFMTDIPLLVELLSDKFSLTTSEEAELHSDLTLLISKTFIMMKRDNQNHCFVESNQRLGDKKFHSKYQFTIDSDTGSECMFVIDFERLSDDEYLDELIEFEKATPSKYEWKLKHKDLLNLK